MAKHTRPRPERDALWASALGAAAAFARRAAFTEADVVRAVTEELRRLKLVGALTMFTPEGMLELRSHPVSPSVEATLRRLTGTDVFGYQFDPYQVDIYRKALTRGEAVFSDGRSEIVGQIVPASHKALVPRILHLLGESPLIVAPVALAGETLGALNVTARWLTPEDTPMVAALADHAAIALGQARSRAEMRAALERERLRNQVAETIASDLDLPLVLERVLHLAADVSGADAGCLALLSSDGESLSFPYLFGLPEELSRPIPRGRGLTWQVVETRKPVRFPDYRLSPHALPEWIQAGVRAVLGVPLIVGEEIIGALGLFTLREGAAFHPGQAEMVQAMARMAAIAIKNSRSFAESQRRTEESQALIRSAGAISASLDLQTVLTEIAEQAKGLFRADGSRIHLFDPDRGVLRCLVAIQPDADAVMAVELKPGQGLTGHVLESGEPLIVNDAPRDARGFHVPGTPVEDPEVLAMAPLKIRQRTMGVMTVLRFSYDRPFTPSDVELLTPFAVHAALALENAHLYGQIEQQAQHLEAEVVERTRDLALSESRYRSLVETSLAGIFQLDLEGHVVYSNQVLLDMLGYTLAESAGLTDPSMGIAPGAAMSVMDGFFARIRGERPASEVYELEMRSRTGEPVPTLVAVSVIRDADGKPQGVTGLVLDISKRKALEAALQTERDRLHAILTNIGDAVMVTDIDGIIEYVNPAWERLNGYPAAEAAGENARLIRSGQHPPGFYAEMGETMDAGQQWVGEVVNRRKDGTLYDAAMTITPIKDDAGRVVTFVAVQHDISALKEIDRMKSQFVSDVSHELRTPLTNIRLYLDLLRGTADPERTTRYLETMDRESGRLAHLIDDLLSLSRLEAGTVNFNPAPTDLNPILRALADDRRALAANRGLQLTLECQDKLPQVMGDERLLTQVFTNLLTNALNYTPAGGKVVLRTRRRQAQGEEFVTAEVEDTGLGIPAEEQPLIFRRFFRGHASRKTSAAGTGLGLAICQEILEPHSGRIEVESEGVPGKGSLFTVWLPSLTVEAAG